MRRRADHEKFRLGLLHGPAAGYVIHAHDDGGCEGRDTCNELGIVTLKQGLAEGLTGLFEEPQQPEKSALATRLCRELCCNVIRYVTARRANHCHFLIVACLAPFEKIFLFFRTTNQAI